MNSVPSSTVERIQRYLVGLRMPRALEALDATLKRFEQGDSSMLEVLETLLGEEFTTRETRRIRMALQTARLGTIKTLAGYDFSFQPSLDRDRIMTLAQLDFIERRQAVHFLGPPGTGKSHLSIALGVEAVRAGKSVYFGSLAEIVSSMAKAEREEGMPGRKADRMGAELLDLIEENRQHGSLHLSKCQAEAKDGAGFTQIVNAGYGR